MYLTYLAQNPTRRCQNGQQQAVTRPSDTAWHSTAALRQSAAKRRTAHRVTRRTAHPANTARTTFAAVFAGCPLHSHARARKKGAALASKAAPFCVPGRVRRLYAHCIKSWNAGQFVFVYFVVSF